MKKYSIIVFCLFLHVFSSIAQESYLDLARQAEELSKKGNYEESYTVYTKAIAIKSDDYKIWVNRGVCLINQKHYEEAISDFNQALKLQSNDPYALQGRASSKALLKDYKGAITDLTTLITLQPKEYSRLQERGKLKIQLGDISGALIDLKECLNRSYKPAETNYWIGVAYFTQKDFNKAADALHTAASLDKTLIDASFREALALAELGRYAKSIGVLGPIIEKNSTDVNLFILRATLSINAGNYSLAKSDIAKITQLKPGSTDAVLLNIKLKNSLQDFKGAVAVIDSMLALYPSGNDLLFLERGKALYRLGSYEEAEPLFEQALSLNPENVEPYHERGMMFLDKREYRKAMFDFNKATELNDQLPLGWFLKGKALIGLEQGDEALVAINQGLELNGDKSEIGHHFLGLALATNGNDAEALKEYEKSLSLNATYAPVRVDRANLFLKQGKIQEALTDLQAAVKSDPNNVMAHCGQGSVLLLQKKYEQALQAFSKAIKLQETSFEAYTGRGQAYVKLGKQKEAMNDFTKAIELNNEYADAYYYRGLLYKKMGDMNKAEGDFHSASAFGNEQATKELEALNK